MKICLDSELYNLQTMPDVFKNIYSYDENGEFYQIRDPEQIIGYQEINSNLSMHYLSEQLS